MNSLHQASKEPVTPFVSQQKGDVIYIKNPADDWRFGRVVTFGQSEAMLLALHKNQAAALMLNKADAQGSEGFEQQESLPRKFSWGKFQTIAGTDAGSFEVDLTSKMPKPALIRDLNREQLLSGHLRVDLLQPMTKGNVVLFKGSRNVGKTSLATSAIRQFLAEDSNARVVYVSMSSKGR